MFCWSYSKYKCYSTCPFLYKNRYILKLPEPKGPALERGIDIHTKAEKYLKGETRALPKELAKLGSDFRALKKKEIMVEENWAIDKCFKETEFFGKTPWYRFKVDACEVVSTTHLKTIDFKTGRIYDDYDEQLEAYAFGTFALFDVEKVDTELWYIDQGKIIRGETFHVSQYPELKKTWVARAKPMEIDKRFDPTPNSKCCWCHFRRENNGPCKF